MGNKEILESNKLVARFMLLDFNKHYRSMTNKYSIVSAEELMFHSSWDWLMPVVQKINSLKTGIKKINICPYHRGTTLGDDLVFDEEHELPIIQTLRAVTTFIKTQ